MKKLQASILLAGILLIAFTGFLNAQQMPGDPHAFEGEANYNDGTEIDGLEIIAKINGNSFSDTIENGNYDLTVESSSGGTIDFEINGTNVGDHNFKGFESTNKDFNTNIPAPNSSGNNNGGNNKGGDDDSSGDSSDEDSSEDDENQDDNTIQLSSDSSDSGSNSNKNEDDGSGSDGTLSLNEDTKAKKNEGQGLFGITGSAIGNDISALNFLVLAIGSIFLIIGAILVIKTSKK